MVVAFGSAMEKRIGTNVEETRAAEIVAEIIAHVERQLVGADGSGSRRSWGVGAAIGFGDGFP